MSFQIPPAALCAAAGALALAACQGKAPAQVDAIADPTVAVAVSQNQAPAFVMPADPAAGAAPAAPPSTLGESAGKGFNHTFNIVPVADVAPAPAHAGGDAATEAGEDD